MPIDRFLFDLLGVGEINGVYDVAIGTDRAEEIRIDSPFRWYVEGHAAIRSSAIYMTRWATPPHPRRCGSI
jgi:hypothetical protein